jgi:hypothetical protein
MIKDVYYINSFNSFFFAGFSVLCLKAKAICYKINSNKLSIYLYFNLMLNYLNKKLTNRSNFNYIL